MDGKSSVSVSSKTGFKIILIPRWWLFLKLNCIDGRIQKALLSADLETFQSSSESFLNLLNLL